MNSNLSKEKISFLVFVEKYGIFLLFISIIAFIKQGVLNGITILIALIGLILWCKEFKKNWLHFHQTDIALFVGLFFIPLIISLFNAIDLFNSLKTIISFSRYLFAFSLIYIICQFDNKIIWLTRAISGWMLFICLDALLQWAVGRDVLGYPYDGNRITGIFAPRYHLGYFLATLSPIFLETLKRDFLGSPKKILILPLLGILVSTIVISNTRAAWLCFAFSLFIWGSWNIIHKKCSIRFLILFCTTLVVFVFISLQAPFVRARIEQSTKILSSDQKEMNEGFSARISLWKTAMDHSRGNIVSGIGVGNSTQFYATTSFEERGNQQYVFFPHLFILEVWLETGGGGVIAYAIFYFGLLLKLIFQRRNPEWLMVCLVATMPLNTHIALYGSFGSSLIWFPLLIGLILYANDQKKVY